MQSRLPLFTVAGMLALLVYGLVGTSWFYIYDIQVEGARFMTKEEIYNRSNLEALHIFWLNPPAIVKQLEADPLVMRAVVSHLPPNRARIQLQERLPVAVWQTGGESYYVDRDGVLFGLRGDARGMLVIRDLSGTPVQPGDTVNPEAIRTALELSELLPERRAFDWQSGAGISYLTEEEWQVIFGDHTRLTTKLAAYHAFREQIQPEEKVLVLDLSVPEHPYYRVAQP
jgi:cell division septal protein FtsQ